MSIQVTFYPYTGDIDLDELPDTAELLLAMDDFDTYDLSDDALAAFTDDATAPAINQPIYDML